MTKTVWSITAEETTTELHYYHFGNAPKFPTWYFEEDKFYEVEMIWNIKLIHNFKTFFKCLTKFYILK